jgi:hypothetical protein
MILMLKYGLLKVLSKMSHHYLATTLVVVDNDLKWIKVKTIIDHVVLSIARFLKDEII